MAKKQVKRNSKSKASAKQAESLAGEVTGVLFMVLGILLGLSLYTSGGSSFVSSVNKLVFGLFGVPGYALPVFICIIGVIIIAAKKIRLRPSKLFSFFLGIVAIVVLFHVFPGENYDPNAGFSAYIARSYSVASNSHIGSGAIGAILSYPSHVLLGNVGAIILNFSFILISIMLLTRLSLKKVGRQAANVTRKAADATVAAVQKVSVSYEENREKHRAEKAEREKKSPKVYSEEIDTVKTVRKKDLALWGEDESTDEPEAVEIELSRKKTNVDFSGVHSPYGALYPGLPRQKSKTPAPENRNNFFELDNLKEKTAPSVSACEDTGYITMPTIMPGGDFEGDAASSPILGVEEPEFTPVIPEDVYSVYDSEPEIPEDEPGFNEYDDEAPFDEDNDEETTEISEDNIEDESMNSDLEDSEEDEYSEDDDEDEDVDFTAPIEAPKDEYVVPPMSFLQESHTAAAGQREREEMRLKTDIIESTLKSFSINAKVTNVVRGPVVTRYELQPAPGVKVRKIVELTNDIALNLAAEDIRIEAPIPGKAAIGIEVPNENKTVICARELLDTDGFKNRKTPITFALGKDIVGKNVYADIAKMPHLLIAGETGSGKSVCINTIIVSLIYGSTPSDVKLILVDPKKVELKPYENIPHLMIPIVTDPKKAAGALNWAVAEMMNRYKMFAAKGAKDLPRYNNIMLKEGSEKLPYLVIIIDELADLMMTSSKEVEDAICRIAQLGRASGIHLVIATQTPRVNVITGNIKINVPTRIAFAVSSQIDSRVILDSSGAEKLLGRGDMLYIPPGSSKPVRVQGCYIDDSEIESITDFLRSENSVGYDEALTVAMDKNAEAQQGEEEDGFEDEKMRDALRLAIEYEQVSSSMLQRRMKIGFNRAARIVDAMEERGFVGPSEGAKPRQVLIGWEEFNAIYGNK